MEDTFGPTRGQSYADILRRIETQFGSVGRNTAANVAARQPAPQPAPQPTGPQIAYASPAGLQPGQISSPIIPSIPGGMPSGMTQDGSGGFVDAFQQHYAPRDFGVQAPYYGTTGPSYVNQWLDQQTNMQGGN